MQTIEKVATNHDLAALLQEQPFNDINGSEKHKFDADPNYGLRYLYDSLCKALGLSWNYDPPSNTLRHYTNCVMRAAGDRAMYNCVPNNSNISEFCPQMMISYSITFKGDRHSTAKKALAIWDSLGYPFCLGICCTCKKGEEEK